MKEITTNNPSAVQSDTVEQGATFEREGVKGASEIRIEALVEKALTAGQLVFKVVDEEGVHMRPAGALAKAARDLGCVATVCRAEESATPEQKKEVDVLSVLNVFILALKKDTLVQVRASGSQANEFWRQTISFPFWQVSE